MQEPILRAAHRKPFQDLVGHEAGLAVRGGEDRRGEAVAAALRTRISRDRPIDVMPAFEDIALGLQIGDPGRHMLGQLQAHGHAGEHALIGGEDRILRGIAPGIGAGVGIAEEGRVIAGLAHLAGDIGQPVVQRRAVLHRAVVHHIEAGQHAGARGPAGRALGVVAPEGDALLGQPVEMRRAHDGVAKRREALAPPLVRRDEEDFARCCGSHRFRAPLETGPAAYTGPAGAPKGR